MSTWFSVAAVAPSLARDWHLSAPQLALLTAVVQLGFVAGALTSGITGISDVVSTRGVFAIAAFAAALLNALVLTTGGDVVLATILGFSLAGVYPTGTEAHDRLVSRHPRAGDWYPCRCAHPRLSTPAPDRRRGSHRRASLAGRDRRH
jgi:hypothetical protein